MNANGVSIDYSYDEMNRLETVKDNRIAGNQTTSYTYDAAGNLQSYTYPNTVTTSYAYNNLNRLTTMTISNTQTGLASYSYTLGAAGNRTQVVEASGRTVNYVYDDLYRLTSETIANTANNGVIGYQYDAAGNRLHRNSSVSAVPNQAPTYDANDRLNSDTYDNNGNTRISTGRTFNYDFENKLTSTSDGITIVYDGDGNRVSKTANGNTTNYLVDTNNLTGYAQVVEEIVAGQVSKAYTYGHDLISQRQGPAVNFYQYDGHGSVRTLTDAGAQVTDSYTYEAFGKLIERTGATDNNYLYAGEQFDPDLGFYYNRARYLSVETGRFISQDVYEGDSFDPSSLHKYTYAGNDSVNNIDPSGNSLIELNIRMVVSNILSSMPAVSAFAVSQILRVALFAGAGANFIIGRGNQAITILRGTGEHGVRAWQNAMLQSHRIVTLAESATAATSRNFPILRDFLNRTLTGSGNNPANTVWHHIVEQGHTNATRFGNAVNSIANIVPTRGDAHILINRFYGQVSNAPPWVKEAGFRTVREWMQRQTWEKQYEAGLEIWKQAMTSGTITWHP